MAKARIWSSAPGIISLIFYLIAIAGAVLQFIFYYFKVVLPDYQTGNDIMDLIAF